MENSTKSADRDLENHAISVSCEKLMSEQVQITEDQDTSASTSSSISVSAKSSSGHICSLGSPCKSSDNLSSSNQSRCKRVAFLSEGVAIFEDYVRPCTVYVHFDDSIAIVISNQEYTSATSPTVYTLKVSLG